MFVVGIVRMMGKFGKPKFLLFSLLLPALQMLPLYAMSQDFTWHPQNALSLSVHYSQIVEENLGSVQFTGPGIGGALSRRYEHEGSYQFIELSGYVVLPKTAAEQKRHSQSVSLALKYACLFSGAFGNEHFSVGAFGKMSFKNADYRNYENTLLYWANYYGAGAAFAWEQPLTNDYAFEAVFEIPLVGAAIRPAISRNYKIQDRSVGSIIKVNNAKADFALPGNYLNPGLSVAILTSKKSLLRAVSYKYTYVQEKTGISNPYRENNHALAFTFMIAK